MKNYMPLLIVALITVGVFFAIGSQGDITGLAGPVKHGGYYMPYGGAVARPAAVPEVPYYPGQEVYVGSETLVKRDCILGREIYHANIMQNFPISAALNELMAACDAKGY